MTPRSWQGAPCVSPGLLACFVWAAASTFMALLPALAGAAPPIVYQDSPYLADRVKSGKLPPVALRLPKQPNLSAVGENGRELGRFGGTWRMMIYRPKDVRMMKIYGYARLIGYNPKYDFAPDILRAFDVREGRIFTLTLRDGHKWSDGRPFTTDDFRYYWEEVLGNKKLSPGGIPNLLLVNGKPPKFEVLGKTRVRYTWEGPNPYFLSALARPLPFAIYLPAHYLKRFHGRFANPVELAAQVHKFKKPNWAALHHSRNDFRNPDLPTLQPWMNTTPQPAKRFVGARNPYYHRVDSKGNQLPYIDNIHVTLSNNRLIAAQSGTGVVDLQARGLTFNDFTFLKAGEEQHNYSVRLWRRALGAQVALYPNLNINDPVWRKLFRDVRFRRALSVAINRHEINQVLFYGLALPGNNSVIEDSPLYRPEYRRAWAQFDLPLANRLLDEVGVRRKGKTGKSGLRYLSEGRPLEILVETAGENSLHSDILELIRDSWLQAGIKLFSKPSQREVFRRRVYTGETQIAVWGGLINGIASAESNPWELAPTARISYQWPKWGEYYETKGKAGEPPDLPEAKALMTQYRNWLKAGTQLQREQAWHNMLRINSEQVFSLGLIAGVFQPVVVHNDLVNVPIEGIYTWDPGSYFGVYRPDTFWFRRGGNRNAAGGVPAQSSAGGQSSFTQPSSSK